MCLGLATGFIVQNKNSNQENETFEDDEGIKIKMTAANKGFIKIDKIKTSKSSVTI